MADFTDVEIRIGAANDASGVRTVEARVNRSGCWSGQSKFDLDSLDIDDPQYGAQLGTQLVNPSLLRALEQAGLSRGADIRLRLWLSGDPTAMHQVRWERIRLTISAQSRPLALNPHIAFSRYIDVEQSDETPPDAIFFRLLLAVANPDGLKPSQVIDVEKELAAFVDEFERAGDHRLRVGVMPGRTPLTPALQQRISKLGWTLVAGNTTLRNVSVELHRNYHGLHILGHGEFNPAKGIGTLLLENDSGAKELVEGDSLESWMTAELQLIVFHACLSAAAAAEGKPPFTSLAPRLIRLGLPAAVAMQDFVEMNDARAFFGEFYRTLLDDGLVDVAVNRGRQVLFKSAAADNWSIPALFSRLRTGKLWQTDAIRQAILTVLDSVPAPKSSAWPLLQVTQHTRGVAHYDPVRGASGPCFDLWTHIGKLADTAGEFVILSGASGSTKAAQLERLFRERGEAFLMALSGLHPVLLTLAELAGDAPERWPVLGRIWNGKALAPDADRIGSREFLFLIDAEKELSGPMLDRAIAAIQRLRDLPGSRILMVADESLLPALAGLERARLLVAQPLDYSAIVGYLEKLGTPESAKLSELLHTRGYWDLATQPRFLDHMIELIVRGKDLRSRRVIVESIASQYLAGINTRSVPRSCAVEATRKTAWEIQNGRGGALEGPAFYSILNSARDGREFRLADLRTTLIDDCGVLTPSGAEGVRFVYEWLQAYFAASFLAGAPDRLRRIEDITASLGRLARLRRWKKPLVLLTNMLPSPAELLRAILAGSSLMEGEQLFLAAHCYLEAAAEQKAAKNLDDVLDQIVDTLVWRSSWDPRRPYADRRRSLDHLIELAVACQDKQDQIVPHLMALAFDPVPRSGAAFGLPSYDWAGIRRVAAVGLARLVTATNAAVFIPKDKPAVTEIFAAWEAMDRSLDAMNEIVRRDDPSVSVIAAFALTLHSGGGDALLAAYDSSKNPDVQWGLADAISTWEAPWVQERAIAPWIAATPLDDLGNDKTAVRAAHICYLIQKNSFADDPSRAFLAGCLQHGAPKLQGRALRAYAKLQDPHIEKWLRPLCEQILRRRPDRIDAAHLQVTDLANPELQRAALEALRDIGDAGSIAAVRQARGFSNDTELRLLSFQVAEEMYWRLSGGLDQESVSVPVSLNPNHEES